MSGLRTTHTSTVTEDRIDHLGHMNVRFYGADARAGADAFVRDVVGLGADVRVAPVDLYTRHHAEQLLGARLEVRVGVVDAVPGSLTLYLELANRDTGVLAATFVQRLVALGPEGPTTAWPADPAGLERVEIPEHGRSRTIGLGGMTPERGTDLPGADAVPSLARLRELDLAIRRPRQVTPEECDEGGVARLVDAPGLVWGGEPVEDRDGPLLHDGPDGERIGMASMETRMQVLHLPTVGTTIQSHGAMVSVGDKVSHHVMWSHEVDTGRPLVTFEVVNLAFDVGARRSARIPDAVRADMARRLHPELAPAR